jgi:hypothetical protein
MLVRMVEIGVATVVAHLPTVDKTILFKLDCLILR